MVYYHEVEKTYTVNFEPNTCVDGINVPMNIQTNC